MFEWIRRWLRPASPTPLLPPPLPSDDPMEVYASTRQGGVYKRGRLQRRWFDTVQVGDVLQNPAGSQRAVRKVDRYKNGDLHYLTFAKRKCSRWPAAYTFYSFTDIRLQGWRPTGVRIRLDSEMDAWLQADMLNPFRRQVTCCEAKDMP